MPENIAQLIPIITGATAFLLVASLWMGGVVLWLRGRAQKQRFMDERLGLEDRRDKSKYRVLQLWRDGQTEMMVVSGAPQRASKLQNICEVMGWQIPGFMILVGLGALFIFAMVLGLILLQDIMLGLAIGAATVFLSWAYLNGKVSKNNERFEGQLADALGLASRSLSAGHPLTGAFQVIAEEMEDPLRSVFVDLGQKQDLGLSTEQALRVMAQETSNKDLKMFAATIIIQMQSGGNLADTMSRLADVMRDRIRLARKARALTAQTQLSKRILIGVPFVSAAMLQLTDPDYLRPLLETPTGRLLLGIATVLLLAGAWVMNKLADLKY